MTEVEDPTEPGRSTDHSPELRSRWADELAFAVEIAAAAGVVLMDHYERLERIDHKSSRDVVTEADHLSEELVIAAIRADFPGDAILAEESGAHAASASQAVNGRTWVIDPLDGTVNYANGLPVFCVSIGFVVDGRPVAGAVLDPTRGETFAATADGPATLNGRSIRASTKDKLADGVLSLSLSGRSVSSRARAIRREVRVSRSMGSASLALAYVGNGRFDAFVQETSMSLWDIAAAGLVAERAGAIVTSFGGGPWYEPSRSTRTIGLIAAPTAFHDRLVRLANAR
ncbi:MAG TPA: inositol monophosphatase family protein [Candidatus Limnocylindrales bacterium]|nr:inositol monophosphatase family protein [Candidatus Limnocylindrales bacterium]